MKIPEKATVPTMYFIGVTTEKSSIMKVFPLWAKELGLKDAVIKGIDIGIHAPAKDYIEVVDFIKNDPLSVGALVTTHKLDLLNACSDMFDYFDPYAKTLWEVSSISKRGGKLLAHAKDPISSGLALEEFVPKDYWRDNGGEVLLMGAGGSSLAMSLYLCQDKFEGNYPKRITIANRSTPRLESAKEKLGGLFQKTEFRFAYNPKPEGNDRLLAELPVHSLVVNATGLGKDAPGSPITDNGVFPKDSLVWEINYRGELDFLHQAERQQQKQNLRVEDGWMYFIYGWTQVISEVFDVKIEGEILRNLSKIADAVNKDISLN
jgi:shikimate 5-dehydrogenase